MSDPAISAVGKGAATLIRTAVTIPTQAVLGTVSGIHNGAYLGKEIEIATHEGLAPKIFNFFESIISKLFKGGLEQIKTSGIGANLNNVIAGGGAEGFSAAVKKLGGSFIGTQALGGRGLLLVGGQVGLAVAGIVLGAQLAYNAYQKVSEINKGFRADVVNNATIHGIQSLFGLATFAGGAMALFCPPVGLSVLAAGAAGSLIMGGVKYIMGPTVLRYPDVAPWPFNHIFRAFRTPQLFDR